MGEIRSREPEDRATSGGRRIFVLSRVGSRICAVPIEHVSETTRPLPIEPLAGMPSFVLGVSIVRGAPVPVVDAAGMLGVTDASPPGRFIVVRVGGRVAVLAVGEVLGVRALAGGSLDDLPPLLVEANDGVVEAVGILDADLLVVLRSGRIVPPSVWAALDAGAA